MDEIISKTVHHTMGTKGKYVFFIANVPINSTIEECFEAINILIDSKFKAKKLPGDFTFISQN
jgi:hypothetical protein